MSERIRVLLVEDHALVRQGIRQFPEDADDIVVVGEAANGYVLKTAEVEELLPGGRLGLESQVGLGARVTARFPV